MKTYNKKRSVLKILAVRAKFASTNLERSILFLLVIQY